MENSGKINNILIPKVSDAKKRPNNGNKKVISDKPTEFKTLLDQNTNKVQTKPTTDINFSKHASKRLEERNLKMDGDEYLKLQGAFDKLRTKGGKDSLVVTDKAAYILDIKNNKVVTAMDKGSMGENVFTKIDSTLFID
jgi:flagellar operon protein